MTTKQFRHLVFLPALMLTLFLTSGCAGDEKSAIAKQPAAHAGPPYTVTLKRDALFEAGRAGFDASIGGYWLAGDNGTLRLDPPAGIAPDTPAKDLALSIRTSPDARGRSNIGWVRVSTPTHILIARPGEDSVTIAPYDNQSNVEVLRNVGYVRFEPAGTRIAVIVSGGFLRRFAPDGASLAWFKK
ncbi:MAG: hypothetical protein LBR07_03740 [Puniceicoccales bacterium]|jgi:hypothetical protein|nr:hypothetical protein [Puniceicoccales bacterium]